MKRGSGRFTGSCRWLALLLVCGTIMMWVTACDSNVKTTFLTGMNAAANSAAGALIDAAFQSMMPAQDTTGGTSGTGSGGGSTTPQV